MSRASYIYHQVEERVAEAGSRNPFSLAEAQGIYVSYHPLGSLKGFYWETSGEQHIVLNNQLSDSLARLICAHELGHACLHRELATTTPLVDLRFLTQANRTETEANRFAAELLLPDAEIWSSLEQGESVDELAGLLQQPTGLVLFKLRQLVARGHTLPLPEEEDARFLFRLNEA